MTSFLQVQRAHNLKNFRIVLSNLTLRVRLVFQTTYISKELAKPPCALQLGGQRVFLSYANYQIRIQKSCNFTSTFLVIHGTLFSFILYLLSSISSIILYFHLISDSGTPCYGIRPCSVISQNTFCASNLSHFSLLFNVWKLHQFAPMIQVKLEDTAFPCFLHTFQKSICLFVTRWCINYLYSFSETLVLNLKKRFYLTL